MAAAGALHRHRCADFDGTCRGRRHDVVGTCQRQATGAVLSRASVAAQRLLGSSDTMRASIIVLLALVLISTTSSAMADELALPAPAATAARQAPQISQRLLVGASFGGASYGADGAPLAGLDLSYAHRIPSGRNLGVSATLSPSSQFAGAFVDVFPVRASYLVSMRLSAEAGVHRIHDRYSSFGVVFGENYQILSAPNGVVLPYAGGKLSLERTDPSGFVWGFHFQIRKDLTRARHMVRVTDAWGTDQVETQDVGGRATTLGFHLGRAF
jgi:hypothetical protein